MVFEKVHSLAFLLVVNLVRRCKKRLYKCITDSVRLLVSFSTFIFGLFLFQCFRARVANELTVTGKTLLAKYVFSCRCNAINNVFTNLLKIRLDIVSLSAPRQLRMTI